MFRSCWKGVKFTPGNRSCLQCDSTDLLSDFASLLTFDSICGTLLTDAKQREIHSHARLPQLRLFGNLPGVQIKTLCLINRIFICEDLSHYMQSWWWFFSANRAMFLFILHYTRVVTWPWPWPPSNVAWAIGFQSPHLCLAFPCVLIGSDSCWIRAGRK